MTTYGSSTKELLNWAGNTKPVLGKHYYLLYLEKAKHPCSAQMFHEVLKDHYKPSLMAYDFTNRVPDYLKFYQKLSLNLYLDHCANAEQLANYKDYAEYCIGVYETFDYPISLVPKSAFRLKKRKFSQLIKLGVD